MNVICKQITSAGFDLKEVRTIFSNDFDYSFGGGGLKIGKEYLVMGLVIYTDSKCLYYLIDVNGWPDWFPYLLFDVIDPSIPKNWSMKINNDPTLSHTHFICGFSELCSEGFYSQLVDEEESALQIYRNRQSEMEKDDVSLTYAKLQDLTK